MTRTGLRLTQIAQELDLRPFEARKALHKVRWVCPAFGSPPRWDPRVVDLIRAMRGLPHSPLEPVHNDWLTRYQEGTS